jgi:hypothetical protein
MGSSGSGSGSGGTSTGQFSTFGTQIIGPNGNVYQPRGVNIWADDGADLSAVYQNVAAYLPGINFIRAYGPNLASADLSTGGQLVTEINYLTSQGIVVMLEDTCCTGSTPVDGTLTNIESWYASAATIFQGNSLVWFESENEPSSGDDADFVTETQAIYNAVRATGNNNIVVFNGTGSLSVSPSAFSSMTNVVWDQHYVSVYRRPRH